MESRPLRLSLLAERASRRLEFKFRKTILFESCVRQRQSFKGWFLSEIVFAFSAEHNANIIPWLFKMCMTDIAEKSSKPHHAVLRAAAKQL